LKWDTVMVKNVLSVEVKIPIIVTIVKTGIVEIADTIGNKKI